ncbi:MAG: ATPase [Desulfuromonas sp.]|uniref:ABC-ATPase domain-containing protein n=1 Tax=Desulfuromonas sp. TaxID=892 RepID=UPI000CAC9CD1|nr:ABC-ATPase domain-containing protein [Desulfuromonas sp.]PLX86280.1 MAG: ATPase [Desulfuromonas sp.]
MDRLRSLLQRVDGRGYKAYKDLQGTYRFPLFSLSIDHVQGDPFAAPSRLSIHVPAATALFPPELWNSDTRRIALEDYLGRATAAAIGRHVRGRRGIGKSGEFAISTSGQQVLRRNAVLVSAAGVEARLTVGLPAAGRTIRGRDAEEMLLQELPEVVQAALLWQSLDAAELERQVKSAEDQDFLRSWLAGQNLVAFVADGSALPRRSGIDDRPLPDGAVPFRAPESLARTAVLPNGGAVRGMGVPRGVTLIVGGGFHGKSTLLHALERGVYNHLPGDGRERVATDPTAVKIRAEDGRAIHQVNIGPFISNLPFGRDTERFSTENASGSTSQAANIMEALESGARVLLIDEDTSATNFMIRDGRMQRLVTKDKEPITPLLHRVRELSDAHDVSTVIVMGGSGDYLEVADTVIMLDSYEARDVTAEAREVAGEKRVVREVEGLSPLDVFAPRTPAPRSLDPSRGRRDVKIDARGRDTILFGEHVIDLSGVEQLVDSGQTRAIGLLIHHYARHFARQAPDLVAGLRLALHDVETKGLDVLPPWKSGDLALPRLHEVAAAINRIRTRR